MRNSILRVIDDLENRLDGIEYQSKDPYLDTYGYGVLDGRRTILNYSIQELRKVLEDHAKPNDILPTSNT